VHIDRPPSLFIGGLPLLLLYPSLAVNYPALSDAKTPVIAVDISAFQEPNTNGYAVSKTARARKRKRGKKLLTYILISLFFHFLVVVERAYAERVFPQGKL